MSELHNILKEFDIKMFDRDDEDRRDDESPSDEFDFDLSSDSTEDELGDFERDPFNDEDDEFGNFRPSGDDGELDSEMPSGLQADDDDDDLEGEFGGERKVDITDRLKKLLARTTDDEFDSENDDFALSDVDDFSARMPRERDPVPDEDIGQRHSRSPDPDRREMSMRDVPRFRR